MIASVAQPFVFSIRPQYVERILDGRKRWEYRRRRPRVTTGDLILIYETAPASAIVASARVGDVLDGHMLDVWAETHADGWVEAQDYAAYFEGASRAIAIELTRLSVFTQSLPLPPGMVAPQSWARLAVGAVDHWAIAYDFEAGAWLGGDMSDAAPPRTPAGAVDLAECPRVDKRRACRCDPCSRCGYGNSALDPVRVFSKVSSVEQLLVRIDDKLSRLKRGTPDGEDIERDLLGYLVLLRIARKRAKSDGGDQP